MIHIDFFIKLDSFLAKGLLILTKILFSRYLHYPLNIAQRSENETLSAVTINCTSSVFYVALSLGKERLIQGDHV
jgi:hypothetical protein